MIKDNKRVITLLIVIIIILSALCILFATGTISFNYNSVNSGNNQSNGSVTENNDIVNDNITTDNNQVSSSWTNYLLSRHILEAKITRVRSKDLGDSEDINKTITITMDDVRTILSNLENKKLLKIWSEGRGGPDRDLLTISYENNNEKYEFRVWNGTIVTDELDNDFISLLDNSKFNELSIEHKDKDGAFYFYSIDNYNENIFDKYFN